MSEIGTEFKTSSTDNIVNFYFLGKTGNRRNLIINMNYIKGIKIVHNP
jgi:hypothetical protein